MNFRRLVPTLALGVGAVLALMWLMSASSPISAQASTPSETAVIYRYVSSVTGDDAGNDCSDPSNPCHTIQQAVDQADEGDEIRIATYDVGGTVLPPNLVTVTAQYTGTGENIVVVTKSLTLKGGYVYYHPTGTTQWLPGLDPAEVNGEEERRPLYISGDITVTVELLALVHGKAPLGGNVYVERADVLFKATPIRYGAAVVQSSYAEGNGGGLYLKDCHVSFDPGNVDWGTFLDRAGLLPIQHNQAEWFGGGIYVEGGEPLLTGLAVISNTARHGGGICVSRGRPLILGGVVMDNKATYDGGGLYGYYSAARIAGMAIYSNTAEGWGGGVFVYGPVRSDEATIPIIANNYIRHNQSAEGGGIYLKRVVAGMVNNVIADNEVRNLGAGMVIWSSYPRVFHSTIVSNTGGSGIYVTNQPGRWWPPTPPFPSRAYFTNTIVAGHAVGIRVSHAGYPYPFQNRVYMDGTLWWGNGTNVLQEGDARVFTETDISGDPRFTCTGDPPDCLNPYHILTDSVAVDSGLTVTLSIPGTDLFVDIDGDLRPSGEGYDIGADEVVTDGYSVWLVPVLSALPATPGQVVTHTHWLLNSGRQTDTFTLTLSGGLGWATLASSSIVTLTPQTTATVQVRVEVPSNANDGTEDRTNVSALSWSKGGLPQALAVDATRVFTGAADIAVEKWAENEGVFPGDQVGFTVVITNNGPFSNSLVVTLTDSLVPTSAISSLILPPGCTGSVTTSITCTVTLPEGTPPITHQLHFTLTAADIYTGLLINRATVSSELWDASPANNVDETAVAVLDPDQTADVEVWKWADADPAVAGNPIHFTVVITNNGPASSTLAVTLTDSLTPTQAVDSLILPSGCNNDANGHITCTATIPGGTLPITHSLRFTFTIADTYSGSLTNRVAISTTLLDPSLSNNAAQVTVGVQEQRRAYLPLVLRSYQP